MIPLVKTFLPPRDILMPELEKILYSGYIAQGEQVDSFEQIFNEYVGAGNALTLNSGTAALHIALILAGVKEGDEVIVFNEQHSIIDLANQIDTIPYEILTNISQRVKRVYYYE